MTTRWFYVQDDKRLGPVDVEHIVHLVVTAALPATALVWHPGLMGWTEAGRVPEIAAQLPPPLPPGKTGRPGTLSEPPPLPGRPPADRAAPHAPAASPRVEELRRRLEKESNARLYAQLGEELRREGTYAEAIRVCRQGAEKYPAYPSLRLALGRALLESGDLAAARLELEAVLQAAPDNILAERFLGECFEGLGDRARARASFRAALARAPGDQQLAARLRALEEAAPEPAGPTASATASPTEPATAADGPEPLLLPDDPVTTVDDPEPPPAPAEELPPIPLVPVEETFEIERAGDPMVMSGPPAPTPSSAPVSAPAPAAARPTPPPSRAAPPPASPGPAAAKATSGAVRPVPPAASVPSPPREAPAPPRPPAPRGAAASVPAAAAAAETVPPPTAISWPTGRLADHDFADLLREVHARRGTGLLTLNHLGVEKGVRVQDGRLVFAASSSRDDRLGEVLLRRGQITLHQYVAAGRAIAKGKRLGTILVEQGALDARELVKVVVEQTQEIIYSAFQWTEGVYHFTDSSEAAEPITLKLSTPDIILEGIRRIEAWSRIARAVGGLETRYVRDEGYETVLGQMTLSLERLSLLTGLEGVQDLGTICRQSTLPHFEVCRTIWAYRVIGVVRRLA